MARECKTREVWEFIHSDSDDELESEDGDEDEDEYEWLYEEENSFSEEGEEELVNENQSADQHMAEVLDEDEEYDVEIDEDPERRASETPGLVDDNVPEDLPASEDGDFKREWCKNLRGFPMKPDFMATPGLQGPLNLPPWEDCKPIDFYKLFISKEQVKKMKEQTNLYARQKIDKVRKSKVSVSKRYKINTWKSVQMYEVYNFLAIIVHMSVVHKPKLTDYWTKDAFLRTVFPSQIMKLDRFLNIMAFFHLNDNSVAVPKGQPGYDPLHKLRPFINHLNHLFQTTYIPEQQISIDEALCPWRGRLSFKVCTKDKPVKWGIKLYQLCESKSGYVWRFEILCGMPGLSNRPYNVVQRLMEPLKSLGYCLYTDRYYTSPALAEDLASSNTGFTGTVLSNEAGLPKDFMKMKIKRGGVDFRRCKNTMVLRWMDKRNVAVLSTIHRPQMVVVKSRTSTKKKPTVIVDCIKYMGGVNRDDQMIPFKPFCRKNKKWWKKLAFHMLNLTMVQAHCLYLKVRKMIGKPGMSLEDFIISVGEDLVTMPKCDGKQPTGAAVPQVPQQLRLQGRHFPHYLVPLKVKRYCHVCFERLKAEGRDANYSKRKAQRTKWECEKCKKALCAYPCMMAYHTMLDYTQPLQNPV